MTRNKYVGSWKESVSTAIDLPFEPESLRRVLKWGANPDQSDYTHQDIAHWCERFWNKYTDTGAPVESERLMPILADVETQWDLFLANSFTLQELQSLDFATVHLPSEWFNEWLRQL
jgi:hypothetical protein